jgi:hypothetical protein
LELLIKTICTLELLIKIIIIGYDTRGMVAMVGYDSTREGAKGGSKGKPMSFG